MNKSRLSAILLSLLLVATPGFAAKIILHNTTDTDVTFQFRYLETTNSTQPISLPSVPVAAGRDSGVSFGNDETPFPYQVMGSIEVGRGATGPICDLKDYKNSRVVTFKAVLDNNVIGCEIEKP